MNIVEIKERKNTVVAALLRIWESSVKATHLFLSEKEIESIKQYVPQALRAVSVLIAAENASGRPVAFAGINGRKLEMLFVAAENRGQGIGKHLLQYVIDNYSVNELTVNEQNPLAVGFYEHMNFSTYKRTETDEQGNPYPLLYMKKNIIPKRRSFLRNITYSAAALIHPTGKDFTDKRNRTGKMKSNPNFYILLFIT